MDAVECTHCRVIMTSWSAAGSPVRYWQCPFCSRTFSSLYGEVFARGAGARRVDAPAAAPASAGGVPQASGDEIAWTQLKLRASRWFARLEREGQPVAQGKPQAAQVPAQAHAPARRR